MLTHIHIKDFTIIEQLELELKTGMTVITGETGAGKSIVLDALDIALGERAETSLIRHGAERCEITAAFDLLKIPAAQTWLSEQELESGSECIIRRTFGLNGRSRHFINGSPVTLQQLRDLGALLVHIHAQHSQQTLLKRDEQRSLLDTYARHNDLLKQVASAYTVVHDLETQIARFKTPQQDKAARLELLRYQAQELKDLALKPDEIAQLHEEQKQLTTVAERRDAAHTALELLSEADKQAVLTNLYQVEKQLALLIQFDPKLKTILELVNSASIQLQEAQGELQDYLDHIDIDPDRLQTVEQRLDSIHAFARKHHIQPEQLPERQIALLEELNNLEHQDEILAQLTADLQKAQAYYDGLASQLTTSRKQAALKLEQVVSTEIQKLGMPQGRFGVGFLNSESDHRSCHGRDRLEFLVTANKGLPPQPLNKVASGGELSRISLAIHVITAQMDVTPTLIFDEVDVGIGGGTAEIVGHLLKRLGETTQVLCVTHLPQVAAQGDHHLQINKSAQPDKTATTVQFLEPEERVQELARMLGGVKITDKTLEHAREMLGMTICSPA